MSHIVALHDVFLHYDLHGHCSLLIVKSTHTVLLLYIISGEPNLLLIVPSNTRLTPV